MRTALNRAAVLAAGSALAAFLSGCATPYQSSGLSGGYSQTQLGPDVFRIYFTGNSYTSVERTQDFAMLRAADLAEQHNFKCFAILNEASSTMVSSFTTPAFATTTGNAYVSGGAGSYSGAYASQTTSASPETYEVTKPRQGLLIQCFVEKPQAVYTFDAAFVQQSLRQKYKIKPPGAPGR
jgi:hypothetical protein